MNRRSKLFARIGWFRLRLDAWRFRADRADYYEYLAALLGGADGRHSLRDILYRDASRYGPGTVRGRLSAHWASICDAHAGDLGQVWSGTLPAQECMVAGAAQAAGAAALTQALGELSQVCTLTRQARRESLSTLAAGFVALFVLMATLLAVAYYTVPQLREVFEAVPAAQHGASTRRLFGLSDLLAATWPLFAIGGALICAVWVWSFAAVVPPWRRLVEGIGPWRLYRDVQATRFLALLDVLLRRHGNLDARLRTALAAQRPYARPWMAWHLDSMLDRIEAGEVGADTFDTGLLDRRLWWFLGDMTLAHGLEAGLRLARERVQSHLLPAVARQASVLRWWILLSVVAQLIALMLWHYQVIDELRRALAQVYASY